MKKFKAPPYFVDLFQKAELLQDEVYSKLSAISGYNKNWISKHAPEAFKKLDLHQQNEILEKMKLAKITKDYAWSRIEYEKWDDLKEVIMSPFGKIKYNPQTKNIEMTDIGKIRKKIMEAVLNIKKFLKKELGNNVSVKDFWNGGI